MKKPSQSAPELKYRVKELEEALKEKKLELALRERRLAEEKEKVEILKNPCTSSCKYKNEI